MDLFGKKKIAELEKENERLKVDRDRTLTLYNTTVKNHSELGHEYRKIKAENDSLQVVMESKNKRVKELEDRLRAEGWEHMETSKELDRLEKENECIRNRLKSIEGLFKDIDGVFICDFRKARGRAINASNKRKRYKELNKMATSMEKIIKEITKSLTC